MSMKEKWKLEKEKEEEPIEPVSLQLVFKDTLRANRSQHQI